VYSVKTCKDDDEDPEIKELRKFFSEHNDAARIEIRSSGIFKVK